MWIRRIAPIIAVAAFAAVFWNYGGEMTPWDNSSHIDDPRLLATSNSDVFCIASLSLLAGLSLFATLRSRGSSITESLILAALAGGIPVGLMFKHAITVLG